MQIIAGIDGGGTGTTTELRQPDGKVLLRQHFGSLNRNGAGEERFRQNLREILRFLQEKGDCIALCAGLAGLSNSSVPLIFEEEWKSFFPKGRLFLCGDQEIALYGAGGGKPGLALIAGTGSVCTGCRADGSLVRVGGWGHLIDDGGSGYDIGRMALHAVVASLDGRMQKTALKDLIFREWDLDSVQDLIRKVYGRPGKELIASLAPLVDAAAEADPAAEMILEQAADALWELLCTGERKLRQTENGITCSTPDVLPVYLSGGLLTHETGLRRLLEKRLAGSKTLEEKSPAMDAAAGAALRAFYLAQKEPAENDLTAASCGK